MGERGGRGDAGMIDVSHWRIRLFVRRGVVAWEACRHADIRKSGITAVADPRIENKGRRPHSGGRAAPIRRERTRVPLLKTLWFGLVACHVHIGRTSRTQEDESVGTDTACSLPGLAKGLNPADEDKIMSIKDCFAGKRGLHCTSFVADAFASRRRNLVR